MAIVDDEDFIRVSQFSWRIGYTKVGRPNRVSLMERPYTNLANFILGIDGYVIDHKDGDVLNMTKLNFRVATQQQNVWNSGLRSDNQVGYKGVYIMTGKRAKPFQAQIAKDGVKHYLGNFLTAEEAALAYNEAAKKLFGEFARLNVIEN